MAKRLTLFSLRLFSLNAIAMLISLFIMTPLTGIWENTAYKWMITLLFSFLLWLFVWLDSVNAGTKDVKNDKITKKNMAEAKYGADNEPKLLYTAWFGFAGGFLAQVPAIILTAVAAFSADPLQSYLEIPLRIWNITYLQAFISFQGALPYLFFIFPVLFGVVAGLAYLNGPAQQRRLETIIERNTAKKANRVQDDKKNKKKPHHNKAAGKRY